MMYKNEILNIAQKNVHRSNSLQYIPFDLLMIEILDKFMAHKLKRKTQN